MTFFHEYSSEAEAYRDILLQALKGREQMVMAIFVEQGPEVLREKLRLSSQADWIVVFDYLVFQRGLLKVCVLKYKDFFQNLVRQKGTLAMRKVLGIEHSMYDDVFFQILDIVAISGEGFLEEKIVEQGISSFDFLMNGLRIHRRL